MRVLVSTFGSAGDLFPLVPVCGEMRQEHEVVFAVPRSLGLYLRVLGFKYVALGDGSEFRVTESTSAFTTDLDGWTSWRYTVDEFVAPTLPADVKQLEAFCRDWTPDVVLASGFGAAARVVAARLSLPVVEASIYPQHQLRSRPSLHRAVGDYSSTVLMHGEESYARVIPFVGVPASCMLHDPVLLDGLEEELPPCVGFPYWDALPHDKEELREAFRWVSNGDCVVVTGGSFLGLTRHDFWSDAAEAVKSSSLRGLFVGLRSQWAQEAFASRADIKCTRFLPLSPLLEHAVAVIHHGGIGTTFAGVRAGCPAVVYPQAFDQAFNGGLVDSADVGRLTTSDVSATLKSVLGDAGMRATAARVAAAAMPSGGAIESLRGLLVAAGQG